MALIECYECGKEISDKAPSCPHCGAPQLVSKNKELKAKKLINFKQYLKPIGIGLGVIFIPLAAVASVPLTTSEWEYKFSSLEISESEVYKSIDVI